MIFGNSSHVQELKLRLQYNLLFSCVQDGKKIISHSKILIPEFYVSKDISIKKYIYTSFQHSFHLMKDNRNGSYWGVLGKKMILHQCHVMHV